MTWNPALEWEPLAPWGEDTPGVDIDLVAIVEYTRAFVVRGEEMELNERTRDYYEFAVTTDPAVTGLEASFDGGLTWIAADPVVDPTPNTQRGRWLLAGPLADIGTAVARINSSLTPRGRVSNATVSLVFKTPRIEVT